MAASSKSKGSKRGTTRKGGDNQSPSKSKKANTRETKKSTEIAASKPPTGSSRSRSSSPTKKKAKVSESKSKSSSSKVAKKTSSSPSAGKNSEASARKDRSKVAKIDKTESGGRVKTTKEKEKSKERDKKKKEREKDKEKKRESVSKKRKASESRSPSPPVLIPEGVRSTPAAPQDLQSWCEVPSIAHFCSLFRQAFDLLEFDIQELEESFLLMGTPDDTTQLVLRLVIKLLKGCSRTFTNNINEDNYNTYLRRLFLSKREEAEEDNLEYHFQCRALLDDDVDFSDLSLKSRVSIVHQLCEFRLEAEDVFEKVKNLDAASLRVEPLGKDSEGITYWYFYGTRLYKEIPPQRGDKLDDRKKKKKKKKDKKEKKKKKKRRNSEDTDDDMENRSIWSVACLTLEDWEKLAEKYKKSKKKCDRELYETITDSFLPEIVKMFAEKEREEKRRLIMMQPKRASSRIERKRQEQEERDRILALKLEEERRLEEEYDEKVRIERVKKEEDEREHAREERRRLREEMKEQRAKRAAERAVEAAMKDERGEEDGEDNEEMDEEKQAIAKVIKQSRFGSSDEDEDPEDVYHPPLPLREKRKGHGTYKEANSDSDSPFEDEDLSSDKPGLNSNRKHTKKSSRPDHAKSTFANALLKVGTKSTKDASLDKPIRKVAGLLLETAGRSLLQKSAATAKNASGSNLISGTTSGGSGGNGGNSLFDSISKTGTGAKLSFGLYGGHLPVDHGSFSKNQSSDPESDSLGSSSFNLGGEPVKKVFTNWGGEFFKKNLDYRANTNKILEKMNLNKSAGSSSNGVDSFASSSSSSSPLTSFIPGERFKALLGATTTPAAKRTYEAGAPGSSTSSSEASAAKKLKPNSLLNSSYV